MQILILRALPYPLLGLWAALAVAIIRGATLYLQQFQVFSTFAVIIATSLFAVNMYAAYEVEASASKGRWGRAAVAFLFVAMFSAASALTFVASLQQQATTAKKADFSVELTSAETLVNTTKAQMDTATSWLAQQRTTLAGLPEAYSTRLADCDKLKKGVLTCRKAVEKSLDAATTAATAEVNTALSGVTQATLAYQQAVTAYSSAHGVSNSVSLSVWVLVQAALPDVLAPLLFSIALLLFRTNPQRIKELEKMSCLRSGDAPPMPCSSTAILEEAGHIEKAQDTLKNAMTTATLRSKVQVLTADTLQGKIKLESSGYLSATKAAQIYKLDRRTVVGIWGSIAKEHPDILMYEVNSRDSKLWKYKQSNLGKFQLVGADGSLQPRKKFRL